jgi:ketosteroid isomerase-like protein
MSQENVDRAYQAADALDRRDLDAYLALVDEDVEAVSRLVRVDGGFHGHDGIRRWWESLFDTWPDFTTQVIELRAIGDDLTLATVNLRGHGAGSDIPWEWTVWQVGRWRRGKCVWWASFDTQAEALEAVGLSEHDAHADS